MSIYRAQYFKPVEYVCPCCGLNNMAPEFLRRLDVLRGLCGFPITLTSGCRCRRYNRKVGGGQHSAHLEGKAVDIACNGFQAWQILKFATTLGFSGVGIMQKGDIDQRFIHLDIADTIDGKRPRPTIWSY